MFCTGRCCHYLDIVLNSACHVLYLSTSSPSVFHPMVKGDLLISSRTASDCTRASRVAETEIRGAVGQGKLSVLDHSRTLLSVLNQERSSLSEANGPRGGFENESFRVDGELIERGAGSCDYT